MDTQLDQDFSTKPLLYCNILFIVFKRILFAIVVPFLLSLCFSSVAYMQTDSGSNHRNAGESQQSGEAKIKAFPGAEGFGAYAKGGRGGRVIHVTNRKDKGEGSLRWAVEQEGPRTVVFEVSGTIVLEDDLSIYNPFITIAGQTAPGDGIAIRNGSLEIETHDVVIRYLRARLGDQGEAGDAISLSSGHDIIVDHCSASWSTDEVLSASTRDPVLTDVTVQWCFITEALNFDDHSFGSLIRGTGGARYSFHHNLYTHNRGRNPRPGNYDSNPHKEDPKGLLLDFRNNVIYNWGGSTAGYNNDAESITRMNYVGNFLIPGANSENSGIAYETGSPFNQSFFQDNYYNYKKPENQWELVEFDEAWNTKQIQKYKQNQPFPTGPINTDDARKAFQRVLAHGGASLPNRDAIDMRVIRDVQNRTGRIIDSQDEVGGWPELRSTMPVVDTDRDGMPDWWERVNDLSPKNPDDRNEVAGDGYTMLEKYLNGLVATGNLWVNAPSPGKKAIILEEFVFTESPTRDCHASSLLELENGDLLCTWFGGTREGAPDVKVWLSRKPEDGEWQKPEVVADGDGQTVFNPVLVKLRGGDIQIYYCSPGINDGQVITSRDNGHTWSEPKKLPKGFVGPIVNKPVYMDDGTIIAGGSLEGDPGWRIHVERSTDNGKTWTKVGPINDPVNTRYEIIQPTILVHSQKRLQILARTGSHGKDAKIAQTWSEDGGLTWSPVTDTDLPNNSSGIAAETLKDGTHLLVYNHSTRKDPIGGRKGRGILTVAVTKDGINWEAAAVLEYRTGQVQYSYPAVIQTRDGLVHVTYSWHRKRIKHVVLDPKKFETYPIVDGKWPKDKMPWIRSQDSTEVN